MTETEKNTTDAANAPTIPSLGDLTSKDAAERATAAQAQTVHDLLKLTKGDEGYDGGTILQIIEEYTTRRGSSYESHFTGRRVRGLSAAREMLLLELDAYIGGGPDALATVHGPMVGSRASRRANSPQFDTIEEAIAADLEYETPFYLNRDDQPTPTGRTYKVGQPIVRILCGDGTDRYAHLQDLHQIKDKDTGEYRSVEMVRAAGKRQRAAARAARRAEQEAAKVADKPAEA